MWQGATGDRDDRRRRLEFLEGAWWVQRDGTRRNGRMGGETNGDDAGNRRWPRRSSWTRRSSVVTVRNEGGTRADGGPQILQVRHRKRGARAAKQGGQNGVCRSERTYGSEHAHEEGRRRGPHRGLREREEGANTRGELREAPFLNYSKWFIETCSEKQSQLFTSTFRTKQQHG